MDTPASLLDQFFHPFLVPRAQLQLESLPFRLLLAVPAAWLAGWATPFRLRARVLQVFEGFPATRLPRLAFAVAVAAFLQSAAVSWGIFQTQPHTPDEVVYAKMGAYLALGHLSEPRPEPWEFFQVQHCVSHQGRWFGRFHPGWPLLLALGLKLHLAPFLNPALHAATLWLMVLWAGRRYGPKEGLLASGLALVSPYLVFMSGSLLSHTSTAFFLMVTVVMALPPEGIGESRSFLAGLSLGAAFLIRPLTAAALGLPLGLYGLGIRRREPPAQWARWAAGLTFGVLPFVVGYLFYNQHLTGNPLQFPFTLEHPEDRLGFGAGKRGFGALGLPGTDTIAAHTPARAVLNSLIQIVSLSVHWLGFPALSLLPFWWARKAKGGLLWVFPGCLLAAYGLYWDHSATSVFGPRYVYETFPFMLILCALGILHRAEGTRDRGAFAPVVILVLILEAGISYWPTLTEYLFWSSRSDSRTKEVVEAQASLKNIIFSDRYDHEGFLWDAPDFNGPLVYARDRKPERDGDLLKVHPGYKAWIAVGVSPEGRENPPFPRSLAEQIIWFRYRRIKLKLLPQLMGK